MILWMKHQRALNLLNCLHVVALYLSHKNQRALSLNPDDMVIFMNPRDNSQFATIARKMRPEKVRFLMWACKDATSSLHAYFMLDLNLNTEERFQERSNILEDPKHIYKTH